MKTVKFFAAFILAVGMILTSCSKDPISSSVLGVKIQATNKTTTTLKSAMATTPGLSWDTCFMNISKIEFEAEKKESETAHDSAGVKFEWNGPKKVNLFDVNPIIGDINLQPGIYDEVSFKVKALKADAGTSPVFYLSGTYTNSSMVSTPIIVIVNQDIEIEVESKAGTTLNAVNNYTSLINLNLTLLINGIAISDIDAATLTNGKIVISSISNSNLYNKILMNFNSCDDSEFEKD